MSPPIPSPQPVLYVWPGRWNLPSSHPECLAAIMYLQLAIPGQFALAECVNPDLSPSGQLPFMVHGHSVLSTLSSIIHHVAGDKEKSIDASLNAMERAQKIAWRSHIESNLGDLVSHMFYSLDANWLGLTHPVLVGMLPLPQRYYVPNRLRQLAKPRLEAAGLWNLPGIEQEEKKPFKDEKLKKKEDPKDKYLKVFEREKVLEKAKSCFDIYSRLLAGKQFIFHDRPTTPDVLLAAHILLLIDPPFPDLLLQTLLKDSYPTLVSHAHLVRAQAFPPSSAPILKQSPEPYSICSLIPSLRRMHPRPKAADEDEKSVDDIQHERISWGWTACAIFTIPVFYLWQIAPLWQKYLDEAEAEAGDDEDEHE